MRLLPSLLPWLATFLLHSVLLCTLGLAIARALRAPRAREVVLKGALLGAFVTVGLQAWIGAGAGAPRFEVPLSAGLEPAEPAEPAEPGALISLGLTGVAQPAAESGAGRSNQAPVATAPAAAPARREAAPFPWPLALLIAWVAIAVTRLTLLVISQRRLLAAFRQLPAS